MRLWQVWPRDSRHRLRDCLFLLAFLRLENTHRGDGRFPRIDDMIRQKATKLADTRDEMLFSAPKEGKKVRLRFPHSAAEQVLLLEAF